MKALWKQEHGAGFKVPRKVEALVKQGYLEDVSWHNDAMPRFDVLLKRNLRVVLWVDHPVVKQREYFDGKRYLVQLENEKTLDYSDEIITDDFDRALWVLEGLVEKHGRRVKR